MTLVFDTQPTPRFRYSPAVRMGPFVKTAGMVGLDPATEELVPGGLKAEFARILENLTALMGENDLRRREVMSATIYTTALHHLPALNALWDAYFAEDDHLPARSVVGVSQLPVGAQVEADFLFHKPEVSGVA